MEMLYGLTPFLYKTGAALITGELLALAIKHKRSLKKNSTKATGELKGYRELQDIIGDDGIMLSDNVRLDSKYDFEHVAFIAPTGAGKTTREYFPNLLDKNIKGSIIQVDPKGELYEATSTFQRDVCGRKVYKFSPLEPYESEQYNLLEQCEDETEVMELATSLIMNGALSLELMTGKKSGGIEWLQMAEPLLTSALLFVKDLGEPYNTIEYAFKMLIDNSTGVLAAILGENENPSVVTQFNIFKTVATSENTAGSIKVTLASNIKLFTDKKINAVGSRTTFTADDFRKEPSILYITFPERKSNYLAPFIAPFFNQFIDKLIGAYNHKSQPVHLFIDEFPSIGMINNMSTYCATVRSRKISFMLCMQSITQLYQTYGRENGKAILNNLKTKVFLPGISDVDTLQYVESLCGKAEITSFSKSTTENKTTTNESTIIKNVINQDEVRRINSEKCLILTSNKQPVLDTQTPYFASKTYTDRVKPPIIQVNKVKIDNYLYYNKFKQLLKDIVKERLEKHRNEVEISLKDGADRSDNLINEIFK